MLKKVVGSILILCFIFVIFITLKQRSILIVTADGDTNVVYATELSEQDRFCIKFTHSVALSPVEEWFTINNSSQGQIVLQSTVYEDFGAGLPHEAEQGQEMFFEDGKVHITGYDVRMSELYVRVGRVANHQLILEKEAKLAHENIPLNLWEEPGKTLKFSVEQSNLLGTLWKYGEKFAL